jgi:hypothetical protein
VGMTKKFGWAGECGGAGDQRRIKKRATIHEGKRRLGISPSQQTTLPRAKRSLPMS